MVHLKIKHNGNDVGIQKMLDVINNNTGRRDIIIEPTGDVDAVIIFKDDNQEVNSDRLCGMLEVTSILNDMSGVASIVQYRPVNYQKGEVFSVYDTVTENNISDTLRALEVSQERLEYDRHSLDTDIDSLVEDYTVDLEEDLKDNMEMQGAVDTAINMLYMLSSRLGIDI